MYDYSVQHVAFTHKFTGKERDTESGLDNFGERYYGSSIGRFMRPDAPFSDQDQSDPQSWNLYTYVRDNPLNSTDPTGTTCQTNSSDGTVYDDLDGNGCAQVDVDSILSRPSAIVRDTDDDPSYQLANGVSNLGKIWGQTRRSPEFETRPF